MYEKISEIFGAVVLWVVAVVEAVVLWVIAIFGAAVLWVVKVVGALGYPGIVIMMTIESSFIPFPSEVVIPPAGYLTVHGDLNIVIVIACGVSGSLLGALFNYYIAKFLGKKFLVKYQRYLFLNDEKIAIMDGFFQKHGEITTFLGRLIPVVRQIISFPAGLAGMNIYKFIIYTFLGAGIWVTILAYIGRLVGNNEDLVKLYLQKVGMALFPILIFLVVVYIIIKRYLVKRVS
jgi:membrane protein DedA with SNARE-associated domain